MVNLALTTYRLLNIIYIKLPKGGSEMSVRMLQSKCVECNLRQKNLANVLGITEKAMCHKESAKRINSKWQRC